MEAHPPTQPSNDRLLDRYLRNRDEAAFAELVRRFGPMVLGVSRKLLAFQEDADDAAQLVFAELARRAGTIEDPALIGSWLHTVTVRVAHRMRRRRPNTEPLATDPVDPRLSLADVVQRSDLEVLSEELDKLPPSWREPLLLRYFAGLSNAEAAEHLGTSQTAYEGRLKRGRNSLRVRLLRRGVGSAGVLALVGPAAVSAEADHWSAVTDAASELAADPTALSFFPPEPTTMMTPLLTYKTVAATGVAAVVLSMLGGEGTAKKASSLSPINTVVAEEPADEQNATELQTPSTKPTPQLDAVPAKSPSDLTTTNPSANTLPPLPAGYTRDWYKADEIVAKELGEPLHESWKSLVDEINREVMAEHGIEIQFAGIDDEDDAGIDVPESVAGLRALVTSEIATRLIKAKRAKLNEIAETVNESVRKNVAEIRSGRQSEWASFPQWIQTRLRDHADLANVANAAAKANAKQPIEMLFFRAPWEAVSRKMDPLIDRVEDAFADTLHVTEVNIEKQPAKMREYAITALPTFVFLRDGAEYERLVGASAQSTFENAIKAKGRQDDAPQPNAIEDSIVISYRVRDIPIHNGDGEQTARVIHNLLGDSSSVVWHEKDQSLVVRASQKQHNALAGLFQQLRRSVSDTSKPMTPDPYSSFSPNLDLAPAPDGHNPYRPLIDHPTPVHPTPVHPERRFGPSVADIDFNLEQALVTTHDLSDLWDDHNDVATLVEAIKALIEAGPAIKQADDAPMIAAIGSVAQQRALTTLLKAIRQAKRSTPSAVDFNGIQKPDLETIRVPTPANTNAANTIPVPKPRIAQPVEKPHTIDKPHTVKPPAARTDAASTNIPLSRAMPASPDLDKPTAKRTLSGELKPNITEPHYRVGISVEGFEEALFSANSTQPPNIPMYHSAWKRLVEEANEQLFRPHGTEIRFAGIDEDGDVNLEIPKSTTGADSLFVRFLYERKLFNQTEALRKFQKRYSQEIDRTVQQSSTQEAVRDIPEWIRQQMAAPIENPLVVEGRQTVSDRNEMQLSANTLRMIADGKEILVASDGSGRLRVQTKALDSGSTPTSDDITPDPTSPDAEVDTKPARATLIYLFHPNREPSDKMLPAVQDFAKSHIENVRIRIASVEEDRTLYERYGFTSVPTTILMRDSEIIARHTGVMTEDELADWYSEQLESHPSISIER